MSHSSIVSGLELIVSVLFTAPLLFLSQSYEPLYKELCGGFQHYDSCEFVLLAIHVSLRESIVLQSRKGENKTIFTDKFNFSV